MTAPAPDRGREAELVAALGRVRARISDACAAVNRDPRDVTLVAVTKTYPASDVAALVRLGVQHVGESRDHEARAKVAATAQLLGAVPPPAWHFVGRLQSRKCRSVATYASAVHSLDRAELIDKLATGVAAAARPPLEVFVQVSLDDDPERGGVPVGDLIALADEVAARPDLRLVGVMAIPPLSADPEPAFARLAEVAGELCAAHPAASGISAGMSDDLEVAVRHGATHVRVGTALLGRRAQVFG